MPYRRLTDRTGRCYYCFVETNQACAECAHFICEACAERHDAEWEHRSYSG